MSWVKGLMEALELLPPLVAAVVKITKSVEEESPNGGGEIQKKAVQDVVAGAMEATAPGQATEDDKQMVRELTGMVTDTVVKMKNDLGTFRHGE